MTDNSVNVSIPMKFEIRTPPRGMTDYDPNAISHEQQIELNQYKFNIRKENIMYLSQHPEIKAIVSMVIRMTMIQKPHNVVEFIAKLFSRPEEDIRRDVKEILKESELEYNDVPFTEIPDWDY